MTLELGKVVQQIDEMSRVLAERAGRERKALPAARELLRLFAHRQEELRRVAGSEPGQRLRCAGPGDEPLDAAFPAPPLDGPVTLVATDGSQIYPDRHGLAFYYVINVGSILFRHGSGQAARAVQKYAVALALALPDREALVSVLTRLRSCLIATCRLNRRKKHPSTYQLLLDVP